ncbi:hypothetical protein QBC47DRAFT_314571 [Echria macrotheca]|uniref:DUF7907 domain-containing protein n=1 Tax=Echria macrotheca TaxID=438768 RepID=A0AAJ0BI89_9PEZI|nr:hypothetical protein QBC47DRAFT_314571 [Echria macrotheca]
MLATIALLAGLASAVPTMIPNDKFEMRDSKGFRLVVNVTNPAHDFPGNPVNGLKVFPARAGANINYASVTNTGGAVFFTTSTNLTRLSTDYLPTGLVSRPSPDSAHTDMLGLDVGQGTAGFGVSTWPKTCGTLQAPVSGTFAVCDLGFEAPVHPRFVVQYVEGTANAGDDKFYAEEPNVPDNCVAVKLLPECAELAGTKRADGEEIVTSRCYPDVGVITWQDGMKICWG